MIKLLFIDEDMDLLKVTISPKGKNRQRENDSCYRFRQKEVITMPNKDGTGPKGQGPKDGHGKGKGKGKSPGQGPMTGGKKGNKAESKK